MKIVTIGRGNVGGGLAALWRKAGHEVTELGRRIGRLDKARALEDLTWLLFATAQDGAPIFYRFAPPGEL